VILEAGTGIGKSLIMRTASEWLDTAHITTVQKELQRQYTSHGDKEHRLPKVEGRISHNCLQSPSEKCNAGHCVKDKDFQCPYRPRSPIRDDKGNVIDKGDFAYNSAKRGYLGWFSDKHCSYWQQKADAVNAKVVVHNYAYLLTEANYIGDFGTRELLGCDEAHNIKKVLSSFVGFSASIRQLKDYCESIKLGDSVRFEDYHSDIGKWVELIDQCLKYFSAEYPIIEEALKEGGLGRDVERMYIKLKNEFEELIPRLERFSAEYHEDPQNWVINVTYGDVVGEVKTIELKPINVAKYADKYLFYLGNKLLLMSATILDPVKFCNNLNIPLKDVRYINAPSPFDPSKAPIYAMNIGKYNNKNFDNFINEISACINKIMDFHGNQKGIIHCTSNRNRNMIMSALSENNKQRLIAPMASNKKFAMEKHEASTNSVLISISDQEGLDLADNLSRFQIVTSLPFPNLGDAQVAARQSIDPEEYEIEMLMTLIQELGRSIRNMEDYASSYVLPSQFAWYMKKFDNIFLNKPIYPSSFASFRARIKWNHEGFGRKTI